MSLLPFSSAPPPKLPLSILNGGTGSTTQNFVDLTTAQTKAASLTLGGSGVNNTVNGTGNGYTLAPGASISFAIANTNDIWINGTIGDIVSWAGS